MKRATPVVLDALQPLLAKVWLVKGLTEKKRGVLYRRSKAFLHFHEDPAGFLADLRAGSARQRLPASTPAERRQLLLAIRRAT